MSAHIRNSSFGKPWRLGALAFILFFTSCGEPKKKTMSEQEYEQRKEDLVKAQHELVEKESASIDAYALNKGWNMHMTGTGLRYQILRPGKGDSAKAGDMAKVNYKIFLMDGTMCYSSDSDGAKTFKVNEDYVESGLHEGIQLMNTGCKARFILPSYLAHGLMGDNDKIPPMSPVVYEVELLSITKK